jgi:hypothetical protein
MKLFSLEAACGRQNCARSQQLLLYTSLWSSDSFQMNMWENECIGHHYRAVEVSVVTFPWAYLLVAASVFFVGMVGNLAVVILPVTTY